MRVAVVCPYDVGRPGGVQGIARELVDRLAQEGHVAWLVAPGPGDRHVGRVLTVPGNASRVPIAIGPAVPRRVGAALADADVVHVHEPIMPLVSLAAILRDRPRVLTFHADAPRWAHLVYRLAGRVLDHRMREAVLTAVSPTAAAAIPPSWGPVEIIPNAIDVASFRRPGERHGRQVAFLGRDEPRKGLDVLLEAWPSVRRAVPDAELVVMGARRSTAPAGVRFEGPVGDTRKREVLASSAVYVAPNLGGESFGIVLAEAMAAGCAVVASDLEAFTAVVGEAGVVVPVGDRPALAGAVAALLTDSDRRERLRQAGRARVAAYDWDAVIAAYVAAYRRAASVS